MIVPSVPYSLLHSFTFNCLMDSFCFCYLLLPFPELARTCRISSVFFSVLRTRGCFDSHSISTFSYQPHKMTRDCILQVPEGTSPVHSKSSSKGPRSSKESMPGSPSLPPRPPRPSPARNTPALSQMQDKGVPNCHGHEQGGSTKRKINWDLPTRSSDNLSTTAAVDISGADSGVKVNSYASTLFSF